MGLVELSGQDGSISHLLQSLTFEWENTVRVLKSCITCLPRNIQLMTVYSFGNERVKMGSQAYMVFSISLVMQVTIFGRDIGRLRPDEIVSKNKRVTLVHLVTQKRIQDLFMMNNKCTT